MILGYEISINIFVIHGRFWEWFEAHLTVSFTSFRHIAIGLPATLSLEHYLRGLKMLKNALSLIPHLQRVTLGRVRFSSS